MISLLYRVKYYSFIAGILYLFVPTLSQAQGENWDTYMAKYGDKPGSVLVNLALMANAPDKKFPYLVITGPHAQKCNRQGIPANDDIAGLEEILDATTNFITGVTARVLAGTFTYNCDRLNYYYVKDSTGIRSALGRMYTRSYGGYNYTIKIKHDPDWVTYRTFLYPDSATVRWMNYNKVVTAMMDQGDSLTQARDINFDAYFRSDTDRAAFAGFARSKGYKADKLIASESTVSPFEIIVTKYGLVKMEAVLTAEEELSAAVKKHHGFYNGWKAPLGSALKK